LKLLRFALIAVKALSSRSSRDWKRYRDVARASRRVIDMSGVHVDEARCHLRTVHVFAIAQMMTCPHHQDSSLNAHQSPPSNKYYYPRSQGRESVVQSSIEADDPVSYSDRRHMNRYCQRRIQIHSIRMKKLSRSLV